jgi:hypothetical protein
MRVLLLLLLLAGQVQGQALYELLALRTAALSCDSVNDAGLIAYYKLDEGSGASAIDDAGANDLTDVNTVGTAAGIIGTSREFSAGLANYLTIADNPAMSTGNIDFTAGAWVKYTGTITAGQYPGFVARWGAAGSREYCVYINGDSGLFEAAVSSDGTASTPCTDTVLGAVSSDVWYYVLFWHDAAGDTMNLQINGGAVTTQAYALGCTDTGTSFDVGRLIGATIWTGQIDEVLFYKGILTAGERAALSAGCRPVP